MWSTKPQFSNLLLKKQNFFVGLGGLIFASENTVIFPVGEKQRLPSPEGEREAATGGASCRGLKGRALIYSEPQFLSVFVMENCPNQWMAGGEVTTTAPNLESRLCFVSPCVSPPLRGGS